MKRIINKRRCILVLPQSKLILSLWFEFYDSDEAATGFEPAIMVLQTSALPLGYAALNFILLVCIFSMLVLIDYI